MFSLSNSPGTPKMASLSSPLKHMVKDTNNDLKRPKTHGNPKNGAKSIPLGVDSTALPQDNLKFLSPPCKSSIYHTICCYSPSWKHPLASSHFCKLLSVCSNLGYYHWFRDNLEQTLADSCDSNPPRGSPYGRHLLCQEDALVVGDWIRTQLSCQSFHWTLLGLGTVNLRDAHLLCWPQNLSSQRVLTAFLPTSWVRKWHRALSKEIRAQEPHW